MLVYDGIFEWDGWGGQLKLAKGRCRLWIFDLNCPGEKEVLHLRPMVVVASDLPRTGMMKGDVSVRSAAGHIATVVSRKYRIGPQRMQFVEYTPGKLTARTTNMSSRPVMTPWSSRGGKV